MGVHEVDTVMKYAKVKKIRPDSKVSYRSREVYRLYGKVEVKDKPVEKPVAAPKLSPKPVEEKKA